MSIRMPFGKHKGTPIENLPTDYVDFLLDWMDSEQSGWMSNRKVRLFDALQDIWEAHKTGMRTPQVQVGGPLGKLSPEARALLPEFVKEGYKGLSRKLHPDVGGSNASMVALTELKKALEKLK